MDGFPQFFEKMYKTKEFQDDKIVGKAVDQGHVQFAKSEQEHMEENTQSAVGQFMSDQIVVTSLTSAHGIDERLSKQNSEEVAQAIDHFISTFDAEKIGQREQEDYSRVIDPIDEGH